MIEPSDRLPLALALLQGHDQTFLADCWLRTEFPTSVISDSSLRPQERLLVTRICAQKGLFSSDRNRLATVASQIRERFPDQCEDFVSTLNEAAGRTSVNVLARLSSVTSWVRSLAASRSRSEFRSALTFLVVFPIMVPIALVLLPIGYLLFGGADVADKLIRKNRRINDWAQDFESRLSDPPKTAKLLDELNTGKLGAATQSIASP